MSSEADGGATCTGARCAIDPPGPPRPTLEDAGVPDAPPVDSSMDASVDASEPPVEPADAGDEPSPVTPPACWTLELTSSSSVADASCLGLSGWNQIENDPEESEAIELGFRNGDACFEGSITSDGWAVYNMQLAGGNGWNAAARGVGGFAFDMTGAVLPPSLQVKYHDGNADFCGPISVAGSAALRFSDAHPNCASTGSAPSETTLEMLRVVFPTPSSGGSYSVDFCIRFRALPAD